MSNSFKKFIIIFGIIMLVLNISLIIRHNNALKELDTWKAKVRLTISEQLSFMEHELEGKNLSEDFERIKQTNDRFNELISKSDGYRLLLDIGELGCRQCLNMEIKLFKKFENSLSEKNVNVFLLISSLEKLDFLTLVTQYQIKHISVLIQGETISLKGKYGLKRNPLLLFVNNKNDIIFANFSDYTNEEKSINFYNKIKIITSD